MKPFNTANDNSSMKHEEDEAILIIPMDLEASLGRIMDGDEDNAMQSPASPAHSNSSHATPQRPVTRTSTHNPFTSPNMEFVVVSPDEGTTKRNRMLRLDGMRTDGLHPPALSNMYYDDDFSLSSTEETPDDLVMEDPESFWDENDENAVLSPLPLNSSNIMTNTTTNFFPSSPSPQCYPTATSTSCGNAATLIQE